MKKKLHITLLCLLTAVLLVSTAIMSSCAKKAPQHNDLDFSTVDIANVSESDKESDYVIIDVKDYGKIVVRLFPDVAPNTVKNFKKLVGEKFYDGLIFHRVIEGFMIQGGGFTPDMNEKRSPSIKGEFTTNGFENNLRHVKGVISMARTNMPDSASSQFFIMHKDSPHLDGQYAGFGYTVCGLDVVDAIATCSTNSHDVPKTDVIINSIRFAKVA